MNLIDGSSNWIPVRRASGKRERIAPHEITDGIETDPVASIDAPRADFNGALVQFLVGLVQTVWDEAGDDFDRDRMVWEPPTLEDLAKRFARLGSVFELDGDGPRFMQDPTLSEADKPAENDISGLFIDAPGGQALRYNTDHFVKRGGIEGVCPECAATALFSLQTNAPAGGAGHRTSLRGGGPLTTLLVYTPLDGELQPALWRDIASNVLAADRFRALCDARKTERKHRFPWLAPISDLQAEEGETQPLDVHPAQLYWAMPRRIRLDTENVGAGRCDVCGRESERLIKRYLTRNKGLNYKGPWRHPLSPYYGKSQQELLPMHPQPGGMGYRHWLGWVLGVRDNNNAIVPATVLSQFLQVGDSAERATFRLWAFGYDMDNMKPRCWYESRFPLFALPDEGSAAEEALQQVVRYLIAGAEQAASDLRWAVKTAWVGAKGELRGDLSFVDASFWSETEPGFFAHVEAATRLANEAGMAALDNSEALRGEWLKHLHGAVFRLFDRLAASDEAVAQRPERLSAAHKQLRKQLHGKKLYGALGLSAPSRKGAPDASVDPVVSEETTKEGVS